MCDDDRHVCVYPFKNNQLLTDEPYDSCQLLCLHKVAFNLGVSMTSVFKTSLCNQFSIIVGHLVYQHRRLNEFKNLCIADT